MKESIKVIAVGDINPGDKAIMGQGLLKKTKKNGCNYIFDKVKNYVNDADLSICNLEGVLSSIAEKNDRYDYDFCGLPNFAHAMKKGGFKIINVANNHVLEHGNKIFCETKDYLRDAGLYISGLKSKKNQFYSDPIILEKNDVTLGIIAYNWVGIDKFDKADDFIAQSRDSITNYTWNRNESIDKKNQKIVFSKNKKVIKDLKLLKKQVDHVILYAHWAYEYIHLPPYGVFLEAKSFIDNGADTIIGTHPHVLQGWHKYKGKYIFFSLGNFIFDSRRYLNRLTVILKLTITKERLVNFELMPFYINRNFQTQSANKKQSLKIKKIIQQSTKTLNSQDKSKNLSDEKLYGEYEKKYRRAKFIKIFEYIIAIKNDYKVVFIIFEKFRTLIKIMKMKFQGENVRW